MKKILAMLLVLAMMLPMAALAERNEELGYDYGVGVTFKSDEPVSYSFSFSDHENYPIKNDWRLFTSIEEATNVNIIDEMTIVARVDFDDKMSVLINSGDASYVVPKTYEESKYIAGGQILPISDWVQYMPNYLDRVEKWGLEGDMMTMYQSDGKYYRLPGLKEVAMGGYSYAIRKDVFEAAGVDVASEINWTYEDLYEALLKVKAYTGKDYVFSDRFFGDSTLSIAATVYGVTAGWGKSNGMKFDWENDEFYFAEITQEMKDYLLFFRKLIDEGLMDIESFTQEDDEALSKFYTGESFIICSNYQNMNDMASKMQVEGAELYMLTTPGGPAGMLQIESGRLECGTMISKNALDELGEEEFIKMLRFIDWMYYSDEGNELMRWGVEGEHYTVDADGTRILNADIYYNGINPDSIDNKQLNTDYGFSGGNFMYNDGTADLMTSMKTAEEKDWVMRIAENRTARKLDPPIMGDEKQSEEMNLISTPLMDYVDTMTLKFILGEASIENDWDAYIAECEAKGCLDYEDMCNDIWQNTKSILGY